MRRTAMMRSTFAGALVAAFAMVASVAAHEHATGVVKERMDAMESMAKAMKAMSERAKANRDLTAIKSDAQVIQRLTATITALFPAGSMQQPTQARAAIWQNWDDFENKARLTELESGKLAAVDAKDLKAVSAQLRALSQACSGCHERYRAKKPKHEHM